MANTATLDLRPETPAQAPSQPPPAHQDREFTLARTDDLARDTGRATGITRWRAVPTPGWYVTEVGAEHVIGRTHQIIGEFPDGPNAAQRWAEAVISHELGIHARIRWALKPSDQPAARWVGRVLNVNDMAFITAAIDEYQRGDLQATLHQVLGLSDHPLARALRLQVQLSEMVQVRQRAQAALAAAPEAAEPR